MFQVRQDDFAARQTLLPLLKAYEGAIATSRLLQELHNLPLRCKDANTTLVLLEADRIKDFCSRVRA